MQVENRKFTKTACTVLYRAVHTYMQQVQEFTGYDYMDYIIWTRISLLQYGNHRVTHQRAEYSTMED